MHSRGITFYMDSFCWLASGTIFALHAKHRRMASKSPSRHLYQNKEKPKRGQQNVAWTKREKNWMSAIWREDLFALTLLVLICSFCLLFLADLIICASYGLASTQLNWMMLFSSFCFSLIFSMAVSIFY